MAADDVEKWEGRSFGRALLSVVRGSVFGLIPRMTVHAFKRYWRLLWICFILSGISWVFYIIILNGEPPIEIREELASVNEENIFHQSLNEQLPLFHQKKSKIERQQRPRNPSISQKLQQNKHIEDENQIDVQNSIEIEKQLDIKEIKKIPSHSKKLTNAFVKKPRSFDKKSKDINKLGKIIKSRKIITQKTDEINIKTASKNSDILMKHKNSLNQTKTITVTKTQNEVNNLNFFTARSKYFQYFYFCV